MQAVVDTNVLVAAAINPDGRPAEIVARIRAGVLIPVFSTMIVAEYEEVLLRPRFGFPAAVVDDILEAFHTIGIRLEPPALEIEGLPDPDDGPFITLARYVGCPVITGNLRDYPPISGVRALSPAQWLEMAGGG